MQLSRFRLAGLPLAHSCLDRNLAPLQKINIPLDHCRRLTFPWLNKLAHFFYEEFLTTNCQKAQNKMMLMMMQESHVKLNVQIVKGVQLNVQIVKGVKLNVQIVKGHKEKRYMIRKLCQMYQSIRKRFIIMLMCT